MKLKALEPWGCLAVYRNLRLSDSMQNSRSHPVICLGNTRGVPYSVLTWCSIQITAAGFVPWLPDPHDFSIL